MDLLFNKYILNYVRTNKDESMYYKCLHHTIKEINNLKEKKPCPASAIVFNGAII
jgi:hypothetical protein